LDIDNDLLEKLLQAAGTKVKNEAVVMAIKSLIEMKKREELAEMIGKYDFGYTPEGLERMREDG
jgi:Arc/MetJ family transcription regulator